MSEAPRVYLDAIRLAVIGAANPTRAVSVIEDLLLKAPKGNPESTEPVRLLVRSIKRVRRLAPPEVSS